MACTGTPTPSVSADGLKIEFMTNPEAPAVSGDTELTVLVKDKDGKPVEGATVTVKYDMVSMSMGETSGQAVDSGGGRYALMTIFAHGGKVRFQIKAEKAGQPTGTLEKIMDVK